MQISWEATLGGAGVSNVTPLGLFREVPARLNGLSFVDDSKKAEALPHKFT